MVLCHYIARAFDGESQHLSGYVSPTSPRRAAGGTGEQKWPLSSEVRSLISSNLPISEGGDRTFQLPKLFNE